VKSCQHRSRFLRAFPVLLALLLSSPAVAQEEEPSYLRDRGPGMATSMFGTYVQRNELKIYPFYEFYYDHNTEYAPEELGYAGEEEFEGEFMGHEGLLYMAYGITDWLMFEFEAALMSATLWTGDEDTITPVDSVHEKGLGDVEGQFRWRYNREREKVPEIFSFLEIVLPLQRLPFAKGDRLIGTRGWEFKLGAGVTKGFRFGTLTGRIAVEYDGEDEEVALGEYAVEYLKKLSDHLKLFLMFEGSGDELELVLEGQVHFNRYVALKIGTGVGLTPATDDIAPETGLMCSVLFGGKD
jgi:hypothetical protein